MKRKKTSGEAPVEGGGRAKRAAANAAKRPSGTASVPNESAAPVVTT